MEVIYISTHILMIGSILSVLYIAIGAERKEVAVESFDTVTRRLSLVNKFKVLARSAKTRTLLFHGQISRIVISYR